MNHFWKKFGKEYLLDLRERLSKHLRSRIIYVKKWNLLLIYEEIQKGNKWHLGVIRQVIKTSEEEICGEQVKVVEEQEATNHRDQYKSYTL